MHQLDINDKYEKIAILRDEMKKKTSGVMVVEGGEVGVARISNVGVGVDSFSFYCEDSFIINEFIELKLYSDIGQINILSKSIGRYGAQGEYMEASIPIKMIITQRRKERRFTLRKIDNFYCYGKFRNGESYRYDISDISLGGCALISFQPNMRFLVDGGILKNSVISLPKKVSLNISLRIASISYNTIIHDDKIINFVTKISCEFLFQNDYQRNTINQVILDLTNNIRKGHNRYY